MKNTGFPTRFMCNPPMFFYARFHSRDTVHARPKLAFMKLIIGEKLLKVNKESGPSSKSIWAYKQSKTRIKGPSRSKHENQTLSCTFSPKTSLFFSKIGPITSRMNSSVCSTLRPT